MAGNEIYGMLSAVTVEIPYDTPAEQAESDKRNEELKSLGVRTFRGATDWGYRKYEDTVTAIKAKNPLQKFIPEQETPRFQSGDLVKIFKTVTSGDVHWQGMVDFDRKEYHHGFQKNMTPSEWARMFFDHLPAKLERADGTVIYGALSDFAETGTEGIVWSVQEYGKPGYEGLHCLQDGDKLIAYSFVRDGDIEWQGQLDFGPEQIKKIGWTEILREAKHMNTAKWLEMCWENRPVIIEPK